MYEYLVLDRHMDTDEARCILSDIDEIVNNAEEAWDVLEELV
jgi:hypothetical protein